MSNRNPSAYCSIKNVVCTFSLGRPFPIIAAGVVMHARHDNNVFPAMVSRCKETGVVVSVFGSGNGVCVGCVDASHGLYSAVLMSNLLWRTMGIQTSVLNFKVCNIVCKVQMPFRVNLNLFYSHDYTDKEWAPEIFTGLCWRVKRNKSNTITFAIFDTGRGVATGLKKESQVRAANDILTELEKFEQDNEDESVLPKDGAPIPQRGRSHVKRKRKASAMLENEETHQAAKRSKLVT
jgi:TATA-box binding protein (TBP) (component of TFIID and TFIIIB)